MHLVYILICVFFFHTNAALSAELTISDARVVAVHDGDTITVLDEEKSTYKIRLAEIDAPESKQPYGQKSKQVLSDYLFNQSVTIKSHEVDRYGRVIGYVYLDGRDVNQEMVEQGAAWVYRKYSQSEIYIDAEASAKEKRVGIWSLHESEIYPPWEWRKLQKQRRASKNRKELIKSNEKKTGTD